MILRFYDLGRNFTRSLLKSTKMGLPRINQRNILMLVLSMSLFSFYRLPSRSVSLEPCSCEPGVSGISDVSAYEVKRAFIVIGIDEDEFFEARPDQDEFSEARPDQDEFSELGKEFIGKR